MSGTYQARLSRPLSILFDVRCLQDADYVERGIGRHATALIKGARDGGLLPAGTRLVALQASEMPPMSTRHRDMFDAVHTTAYTGALAGPVWFVQLSPMTHDPLFCARLLHHAAPLAVAAIYDFIPFDQDSRYLAVPPARLDYNIALAWLARYDMFASISQSSAVRLSQLVPASAGSIVVTGAPLDPLFVPAGERAPGRASHVLVIGGGDPRKNVEGAVRGHAASTGAQARALPLVITGHYSPEQVERLRALAVAAGGNAALLRVCGHVDESTLLSLYRDAAAVIVPSFAEGFSLPVIEAMAAGAPVIASDIPPHAELIDDAACLVPPADSDGLAARLTAVLGSAERQAQIRARQDMVWPRYESGVVSNKFWHAVIARAATRPTPPPASPIGGHKPCVAMATPLPPARSGVADFSAAGAAALAARVDLHLFSASPRPLTPAGTTCVKPLSALAYLSATYDRVISVIGNSEFHLDILRLLTRYGSATVAHDSRMLGFYCALHGTAKAQDLAARELGRPVARSEIEAWLRDESQLPATLFHEICEASQPLFMHSRVSAATMARRFGRPAFHLPFATMRMWETAELTDARRREARDRLGIADGQILIVSLGFVHWTKAPYDCIHALELLRCWKLPAVLHFIGGLHMDIASLQAAARECGVSNHITFRSEFVNETIYRDYLLAADLGLQLRTFAGGAVSAALQDCVTAGLAAVSNEDLADAIDAPSYVARVPDAISHVLVAESLAKLIGNAEHTHRHTAERLEYARRHDFEIYTEKLMHHLELET